MYVNVQLPSYFVLFFRRICFLASRATGFFFLSFSFLTPLQPAFAITLDKAQGQTLDRVIVALSKHQLSITNFQYACLYVALSRVRKRQHLQILLIDGENADLEWQSLLYINNLHRDPSIEAFLQVIQKISLTGKMMFGIRKGL